MHVGGLHGIRGLPCILGGDQSPASPVKLKKPFCVSCTMLPGAVVTRPLDWSQHPISLDSNDHPRSTSAMGTLPLVCTPIINDITIPKMLIVGGAGLNVLSREVFEKLHLPRERLLSTWSFSGVTGETALPLGHVFLPVTFGTRENFHTEHISFDVMPINLPYNAIFGFPALAKFMAIVHHA